MAKDSATTTLHYTKLLLAAGPWNAPLAKTLELTPPRISNLPGHSVLILPSAPLPKSLSKTCFFAGVTEDDVDVTDALDEEGDVVGEDRDKGCTPSIEFVIR